MHHITRFDYGRTRGWWVRIRRRPHPCSKLFSDRIYGSSEKALEAARAWRDEKLETRPLQNYRSRESTSKRIKTGVVGLYLIGAAEDDDPRPQIGVSLIDETGRHRGTQYSVTKWGLRRALWKACVVLARSKTKHPKRVQALAQEFYNKAYKNVVKHCNVPEEG